MTAFYFSPAQAAASMAEGQQASVPIRSLLMQIDADAVCLVRTQFQQLRSMPLTLLPYTNSCRHPCTIRTRARTAHCTLFGKFPLCKRAAGPRPARPIADVALESVHREVHAAQPSGVVGLLDAEDRK